MTQPRTLSPALTAQPVARHPAAVLAGVALVTTLCATVLSAQPDSFQSRDLRVFKATACTQDQQPVEALYYIAASRSDLAAGKASPSSQLMNASVDDNWRRIASRLTAEQVMDEGHADLYNRVLSELIPQLQQAVEEQSGVSISVAEVNSRIMDPAKDQNVPACGRP